MKPKPLLKHRFKTVALIATLSFILPCSANENDADQTAAGVHAPKSKKRITPGKPQIDRTGRPKSGEASYYGREFYGRKMADGSPMDPESNVAASRELPLGTRAEVTNLENGRKAQVEIRDRGPYVEGRVLDVSPEVARQLDFEKEGVTQVEVKPTVLPPQPSSSGRSSIEERNWTGK